MRSQPLRSCLICARGFGKHHVHRLGKSKSRSKSRSRSLISSFGEGKLPRNALQDLTISSSNTVTETERKELDLKEHIEHLQSSFDLKSEQLETMSSKMETMIAKLTEKDYEIESLRASMAKKDYEIESLRSSFDGWSRNLSSDEGGTMSNTNLQKELVKLQRESTRKIHQLEATLANKVSDLETMGSTLADMVSELETMKESNNDLSAQVATLTSEISMKNRDIGDLEFYLKEAAKRHGSSTDRCGGVVVVNGSVEEDGCEEDDLSPFKKGDKVKVIESDELGIVTEISVDETFGKLRHVAGT